MQSAGKEFRQTAELLGRSRCYFRHGFRSSASAVWLNCYRRRFCARFDLLLRAV